MGSVPPVSDGTRGSPASSKAEGFTSCKLEPEIWMRSLADTPKYEYIGVYVNNLAMAMDDPKTFLDILINK
jgi:hypothetical protein